MKNREKVESLDSELKLRQWLVKEFGLDSLVIKCIREGLGRSELNKLVELELEGEVTRERMIALYTLVTDQKLRDRMMMTFFNSGKSEKSD